MHFGVGGFHRAHQAMYLDRLMNDGKALDWGICGVGVMPFDATMKQVMDAQDCLYTLVLKDPDGSWEPRVIGSIVEYLFAPDDPDAVIEKMADPATRIVSLTVTEGGYNFHQVTGEFDADNPAVAADLVPGAVPGTTFGLITEALVRRRDRGLPPFTIMSCDNIQGNGHVAQKVFTTFARLRGNAWGDEGLGDWVQQNVLFPNCMVDRITPATTDQDRADVAERYRITDGWPVVCEPFTQWVLEDTFSTGRPPLEDVGVQLVQDVEPYELMKLRLLNASHQGLCYFGYLAGLPARPRRRAGPAVRHLPARLHGRGGNPNPLPRARDRPRCLQTSTDRTVLQCQCPGHRAQALRGKLRPDPEMADPGRPGEPRRRPRCPLSAAIVASWARYAEGVDEQGQPITIVDRLKDTVTAAASRQHDGATCLHLQPGTVRRPGSRRAIHRPVPRRAELPAPQGITRHPADARRLSTELAP